MTSSPEPSGEAIIFEDIIQYLQPKGSSAELTAISNFIEELTQNYYPSFTPDQKKKFDDCVAKFDFDLSQQEIMIQCSLRRFLNLSDTYLTAPKELNRLWKEFYQNSYPHLSIDDKKKCNLVISDKFSKTQPHLYRDLIVIAKASKSTGRNIFTRLGIALGIGTPSGRKEATPSAKSSQQAYDESDSEVAESTHLDTPPPSAGGLGTRIRL